MLLVQHIRTLEEQALSKQKIPGLDGAVYQNMGRCPTIFLIRGMLVGDTAVDDLTALRQKFQAHEPVSFVADIATETTVTQVLIDDLQVNELAGLLARFEYRLVLREYIPPPPPEQILDSPLNNEANGLFDDLTENLDIYLIWMIYWAVVLILPTPHHLCANCWMVFRKLHPAWIQF